MQIIADRQALHRIPELDRNLPKTIRYLTRSLEKLSCKVFSPMEGALCAWFDFGKESAVAFRADMDALPISEQTGLPFASEHPGRMHACGHDGHMAVLLELARRLDAKKAMPNNVLLVFQPAEETLGGAKDLCAAGIFGQYHVEAIFALHLWPELEAGVVASRRGEMMSHASEVTLEVTGRSSHIAKADRGIDAMAAGVEFYSRAIALERALPKNVFRLLKFGRLESGTVRNAVSGYTRLEGSLRAFQDEVFESLRDGLLRISEEVAQSSGCRLALHFSEGYPAVMNPDELYGKVRDLVPFRELPEPSMISEDFSWYQRTVPGMFFFLGTGSTPALHADTFNFDEKILLKGADLFEALAENYRP